ncbi:MAG: DUF421 domain-containing protein, partial [Candidatus Competibacteraceae bacterium]|nr:DUF421 domain-containing protein [Candidatus Competibacteraceae bacterium]
MIKIQGLWEGLSRVLGLEVDELSLGQMALRAVVVYAVALVVVRLGKKRFLGKNTAFDFILGIMLGSVLSRAITGNSPFFPTLAASVVMVSLHWLFAVLAYHWDLFGIFVKGRPRVLIRDGEIQWKA